MKKAGVRFSNEIMVSFEYDEQTKNINVLVIEGKNRLTGSAKLTNAAKTTKTAKTTK